MYESIGICFAGLLRTLAIADVARMVAETHCGALNDRTAQLAHHLCLGDIFSRAAGDKENAIL